MLRFMLAAGKGCLSAIRVLGPDYTDMSPSVRKLEVKVVMADEDRSPINRVTAELDDGSVISGTLEQLSVYENRKSPRDAADCASTDGG